MSLVIDIADAVAAELNAAPEGTFGKAFAARRVYLPEHGLTDAELDVMVVAKSIDTTIAGRAMLQHDVSVDIAVLAKLPAEASADAANLDALMDFVQAIASYLKFRQPGNLPVRWLRAGVSPIYSQEHLRELRQFTSVLNVTYRAMEA